MTPVFWKYKFRPKGTQIVKKEESYLNYKSHTFYAPGIRCILITKVYHFQILLLLSMGRAGPYFSSLAKVVN